MRRFRLYRKEDVTGVSGTGYVAEGCLFSNGKVAVTWRGKYPTVTAHDSLESVEAIHLHAGLTVLEWLDEPAEAQQDLGHVEILAREVVTDGGDKRTGMSYLVHLSDQSSEVKAEAWLMLMDDGRAEAMEAEPEGV
jgi:hypothetical protein